MAAALGLVYAVTLAPGLSWAHDGADGGDLIAAAASGGVAHPTGYPLYLVLARLFLLLPAGAPAWRVNLLSAVSAAAAAVMVAALVQRSYRGALPARMAGGWLAGLAFGLSPLLWSQAVIAEVYSLHACLIAASWLALPVESRQTANLWRALLAGAALGAAVGNHVTSIFMAPLLGLGLWRAGGRGRWWALAAAVGGMALTAGSLYGVLAIWASRGPAVNWGNAATWSGWWWVVSAEPYRGLAFGATDYLGIRLREVLGLWITQFGPAGVLVGLGGISLIDDQPGLLRGGVAWLFAICTVFAVGYNTVDSYNYLGPAFLAFAVALGLGLARILDRAGRLHPGWKPLIVSGITAAIFWNAVPAMVLADASRDDTAERFIRAVAASAPQRAMIVTTEDRDSFALWYMREALGERRDVIVLVERLAAFDWYRQGLAGQYPDLRLPTTVGPNWLAALPALNDRPVCRTVLDRPQAVECLVP